LPECRRLVDQVLLAKHMCHRERASGEMKSLLQATLCA